MPGRAARRMHSGSLMVLFVDDAPSATQPARDGEMQSATYKTAAETDALENLTKKLAADFRSNVRALSLSPFLSPDWFKAAESLSYMGSVAEMVGSWDA